MSYLPSEIITNILSRLPVKSLLRFRCVSKPWCSLIKDQDFIKLHLDLAIQTNVPNVMFPQRSHLYSIQPDSESLFHEAKEIDYPYKTPSFQVQILGSCNGLLCISPDKDVYCIWNPSTQEFKRLPETPIVSETKTKGLSNVWKIYHGFGYDDRVKDYKVVRIVSFYDNRNAEVSVYRLGTNSWRRVEDVSYYIFYDGVPGVLVNGGLHWAAMLETELVLQQIIIFFDLADERIKVVPQLDYEDNSCQMTVGVLGGRLSVLGKIHRIEYQVWVMMDYGVKESWTKLFSFLRPVCRNSLKYVNPSCKLLLEINKKDIILYDLNSEMVETLDIGDILEWHGPETYLQSLVSLKTGTYVWEKEAKGRSNKRKVIVKKNCKINPTRRGKTRRREISHVGVSDTDVHEC